jgi:hypothetical protein
MRSEDPNGHRTRCIDIVIDDQHTPIDMHRAPQCFRHASRSVASRDPIGGSALICSATLRQAPIKSVTSLSSTSSAPSYSVRLRTSWHLDSTRHTSGPKPSVSGIRIDAKRQALDASDAARRSTTHNGDGNGDGATETEIQTVVDVGDDLTSQSRHSLVLRGSPPAGKLLIPLERRDVRVVEGARLESEARQR